LSDNAAISSALVTMITAIRWFVACCGRNCLVFDQRTLGAAFESGLSFSKAECEDGAGWFRRHGVK
jgi:hypothetical protein